MYKDLWACLGSSEKRSGGLGRNRTTDTRIFNQGENHRGTSKLKIFNVFSWESFLRRPFAEPLPNFAERAPNQWLCSLLALFA
jgi:hypothetical protein